jgi:simple sugar transport system ATP-binding protein
MDAQVERKKARAPRRNAQSLAARLLEPIDLTLNVGEVVGVAGLLGSGRTETANLIFGVETPDAGSLLIKGKKINRFSPLESLKHGVALCPEDRKAEGILGDLTIRENIILALQARYGWIKFLPASKQYEIAQKYIDLLSIVTPSPDQLVKNLSGGNQQKVILARWLATNPQVLILDEPTRGIDVGAKAEIQKLVLDLVEEGKSILFISFPNWRKSCASATASSSCAIARRPPNMRAMRAIRPSCRLWQGHYEEKAHPPPHP